MDVQQYLKDLETLVNMDSFSTYPEGTARVAAWFKERLDRAGWTTELIPVGDAVGPCLKAVWGNPDHYDVILLGHMDTVFPVGTVYGNGLSPSKEIIIRDRVCRYEMW